MLGCPKASIFCNWEIFSEIISSIVPSRRQAIYILPWWMKFHIFGFAVFSECKSKTTINRDSILCREKIFIVSLLVWAACLLILSIPPPPNMPSIHLDPLNHRTTHSDTVTYFFGEWNFVGEGENFFEGEKICGGKKLFGVCVKIVCLN
jgi:hypothetical protein